MTLKVGSLFAGIGGFDKGLHDAGLSCVWQVERDPQCLSILRRHFPDADRLNDVALANKYPLDSVDLICGGWPCQDLSVAGKRAGLDGERSGLFYEYVRIVNELRPAFCLWENVPGLLTSDDGRDFARVLRALDDIGYSGAWTGLDAQWFGVAQRRRRIFGLFTRTGLGARGCAEILSLTEGLRRHPPTRGTAAAGIAAPIKASPPSRRNGGSDPTAGEFVVAGSMRAQGDAHSGFELGDGLICNPIANALAGMAGGVDEGDAQAGRLIVGVAPCLESGTNRTGDTRPPGTTVDTAESLIVSPLAFNWQPGGDVRLNVSDKTSALQTNRTPAVLAFTQNSRDEVRLVNGDGEVSGALNAEPGMHQQSFIAWHENKSGELTPSDTAKALRAGASHSYQGVGVRRLTPTECERLQGFPDGWTAYGANDEPMPDSTRYRMLGNAVAVPCARWLATRLLAVLERMNEAAA